MYYFIMADDGPYETQTTEKVCKLFVKSLCTFLLSVMSVRMIYEIYSAPVSLLRPNIQAEYAKESSIFMNYFIFIHSRSIIFCPLAGGTKIVGWIVLETHIRLLNEPFETGICQLCV